MPRDEFETRLKHTSLHLVHLILHLVQVEVQRGVFLPDSKAADDADIDARVLLLLTQTIQLYEFLRLFEYLAVECTLWEQNFYRYILLALLYHPLEVLANSFQVQHDLSDGVQLLQVDCLWKLVIL